MKVTRAFQATACVAIMASTFFIAGYAEAQTGTVKIVSVKSIKATQGSDSDEIYFSFSDGRRFPGDAVDIEKGQTWKPNHLIAVENRSVIKLYEADTVGDDDLIGAVAISPNDASGKRTELMTGDSSKYVVVLEVNWSARSQSKPKRTQTKSARKRTKTCRYYEEFQRNGRSHELPANTHQDYVGDFWHDKISSYEVSPGCKLHAYADPDRRGFNAEFTGSNDLPSDWNGRISSVECNC